jgi:hypothetical protein
MCAKFKPLSSSKCFGEAGGPIWKKQTFVASNNILKTLYILTGVVSRYSRGIFVVSASYPFFVSNRRFPYATLLTSTFAHQGCQIFLGTIYQHVEKYTKLPQNIPNVHKIYQKAVK